MIEEHGLLRRHRELFALSHRSRRSRRAAPHAMFEYLPDNAHGDSSTRAMSPCPRSAPCSKGIDYKRKDPRWRNTDSACPRALDNQSFEVSMESGRHAHRRPSTCRRLPAATGAGADGQYVFERAGHPADGPRGPAGRNPARPPPRLTICFPTITRKVRGQRLIACSITTLTKRMAEDLTEYMHEHGQARALYLHSDVGDSSSGSEIIRDLRLGAFDVLDRHQPPA